MKTLLHTIRKDMMYDNGWFRITGNCRNGRKKAHYFFNDRPIHVLTSGLFKEEPDFNLRYNSDGIKCKKCLNILNAYSKIGLQNRCN